MRVRRPRARIRLPRRRRVRQHDMWEATDYDLPDDFDVEEWMIAQGSEGK